MTRIGLAGCQAGLESLDLPEAMDVLVRAERVGLDGIWVNEEHLGKRQLGRVCWATVPFLAYVAGVVPRIRLGSAALLLGLHHSLRLAEEIGSLATFAPGRICVGVAPSRDGPYAEAFGIDGIDHRDRFATSLRALQGLLSGAEVDGVSSMAVPDIPPGFYRAAYSPESVIEAARERMPLLQHYIQSPESVHRVREIYLEHGEGAVLRRSPVHRFVALAETEKRAEQLAVELAGRLTPRLHGFGIHRRGSITTEEDLDPHRFAEHTAISGTPDTLGDKLAAFADSAGTDTVNINLGWMGMASTEQLRESAELFITMLKGLDHVR